ncbi:MAG: RluA family pseudouridine synthase [Myxococcaceae bacterium]
MEYKGAVQNPFDEHEPDPRAAAAAQALMRTLPTLAEGKMFGVLVVEGGAVLQAFSGDAQLQGFVPHLYDVAARAALEPQADAVVKRLGEQLSALPGGDRAAVVAELARERDALREVHADRRRQRQQSGLAPDDPKRAELSRADKRERRELERRAEERLAAFAPVERRRAAIERLRRIVSQEAMRRIHDTYLLANFLGERAPMRGFFPGGEPPWGAGECAAVKLLHHAAMNGLKPVALAEFWWGPPPPSGGRVHGTFYPACRLKCGPLLPFIMRGLEVAPRRAWTSKPLAELVTLHEDAHLVVVDKPVGLLSVPGKNETDSVQERLRARHPNARLVHRLDLDTSGVLVAALDEPTYHALQRQFSERSVEKRYVAVLEGDVRGQSGTVSLPMRVDLDQRPRQLVDFEHGLSAETSWQVLERRDGRTRVAFSPRTGRTHQLRVHSAHADGLGAAIVGDRLYGLPAERLMLHAEALTLVHPVTGDRMTFHATEPF